ncbi:chromosomal replication initiator protein DnaA [Porphyromonas sp. COT-239 OH1446]|uniref:chromosomal replication initiator protein DnaA n=1 Tax=Porphyromonas sp. COT-239 OH1446 TaxID=1515613 RepID=UPI00052DEA70|nr:chromosomal replication initiator protein DnaA [Porphyromonas sp. COT-239 OH1446]KGN70011.1 hypothetical protein HQ37_04620 [Porphyromonas sp. COT-239 OH1446]
MPDASHINELWGKCRAFLSQTLNEQTMRNWIDPIRPISLEDSVLKLWVPSEHFCDYLEQHMRKEIEVMLQLFVGRSADIEFEFPRVGEAAQAQTEEVAQVDRAMASGNYVSYLNQSLRFDTFIESECNRMARTLAYSVATCPGQSPLNLLFIHGPSGVGKTHLCQAIGQHIQQEHPRLRVCYVSSAKFENQYTRDARQRGKTSFIEFYQQMDVLLIDDIQGLIGKTGTQKAFFEIFNHLYLLGKQIVLTSDVPPVDFIGMEERMITRIQSSVVIKLERPDIELRRKILQTKVAESGVSLGNEIVEIIAERMGRNVRELDGTIKTLISYSQHGKRTIDMNLTRQVMSSSIVMDKPEITMEYIQQLVSERYNIDPKLLYGSTRRAEVALPRQIVMYMTKKYTSHSYSAIAERLGRRNHTTVMHGVKTITDRMSVDPVFAESITSLEQAITQG